jgi:ribose 5-phosphate isomerase B
MNMKIAVGNDHWGFQYKKMIMEKFGGNVEFIDVGTHDETPASYPESAEKVGALVADGSCDRGVLICGTGIGMALAANKIKGVYAAVCHDLYSTERSILSNNCNVLCMGALVIGPKTAEYLVDFWLKQSFDFESPSYKKVEQICEIEKKNMGA